MTARLLALFALLAGLSGCSVSVRPPEANGFAGMDPHAAWARNLRDHVDDRGRIDFAGMKAAPQDLCAFVYWVSTTSPDAKPADFPTREDKLAYYLNAYNGLAMYNVLYSGVLPEDKVKFFYVRELSIGGQYLSLYTFENDVIRPIGEPRVHFALNCMVRGCPRLPREPFRAERLNDQLDAASKLFFGEARNVELQRDKNVVRFNQILEFYTDDFLKAAPTLIDYANKYRSSKIPTSYEVEFIPYDWTLNSQGGA